MTTYTPPPGNLVGATLTAEYTPPLGNLVGANLGDQSSGGLQNVVYAGFQSSQFGIVNLPVMFTGFSGAQFGAAFIDAPPTQLASAVGQTYTLFGSGRVSNFRKFVTSLATTQTQFGVAWVSRNPQIAQFTSFLSRQFGVNQVGTTQFVGQISGTFTLFGASEFARNSPDLVGFDSFEAGAHTIFRGLQFVLVRSIPSTEIPDHTVRNVVQQVFFPVSSQTLYGAAAVRNLTRRVFPDSIESSRFPFYVFAATTPDKVARFTGYVAAQFPDRFQGFEVNLDPQARSLQGFVSSSFIVRAELSVRNAVFVPVFFGQTLTRFGTATVERDPAITPFGRLHTRFGAIAVVRGPHSIFTGRHNNFALYGRHVIANNPHYVEFEGQTRTAYDWITIVQHPPLTIRPRWPSTVEEDLRQTGVPTVVNVTRVLRVVGVSMTRISEPVLRNQNRAVIMRGFQHPTLYGVMRVQHRTITLVLGAGNTQQIPITHDVWQEVVPPGPSLQYISYQIPETAQVPAPLTVYGNFTVSDFSLRFAGTLMTAIGAPQLSRNIIHFRSWHHPNVNGWTTFATPAVDGGVRSVVFQGFVAAPAPSKFATSPHTVWMRHDTPQQARDNHPGPTWCDVDYFCNSVVPNHLRKPNMFGRPVFVGDSIPNLRPLTFTMSRFGAPIVESRTRRIRFDGRHTFVPGFPTVLGASLRIVRMWTGSQQSTLFGNAVYTRIGSRTVVVGSATFTGYGQTQFSQIPHDVIFTGLAMTLYGQNNPMVHFERVITPLQSQGALWGSAWVSPNPRSPQLRGATSSVMEWTRFNGRMRVGLRTRYIRGTVRNNFTRFGVLGVGT